MEGTSLLQSSERRLCRGSDLQIKSAVLEFPKSTVGSIILQWKKSGPTRTQTDGSNWVICGGVRALGTEVTKNLMVTSSELQRSCVLTEADPRHHVRFPLDRTLRIEARQLSLGLIRAEDLASRSESPSGSFTCREASVWPLGREALIHGVMHFMRAVLFGRSCLFHTGSLELSQGDHQEPLRNPQCSRVFL